MKRVLVTGARGQLGMSIQQRATKHPSMEFLFLDRERLDITNPEQVIQVFKGFRPHYCVNCAAYTQVDRAEEEPDRCFEVNAKGVQNLVGACVQYPCVLVQISTDFVFDGGKGLPYSPEDQPNPINVYGQSKYKGEQIVKEGLKAYFIIRTSWLYSEFGSNFFKTMIRLGAEKDEIRVVDDQKGSPTYAGDLADFVLMIIEKGSSDYGIFHYSNQGVATWFEFAKRILALSGSGTTVIPIGSDAFGSLAKRPLNSVLALDKTMQAFHFQIPAWEERLRDCLKKAK